MSIFFISFHVNRSLQMLHTGAFKYQQQYLICYLSLLSLSLFVHRYQEKILHCVNILGNKPILILL